MSRQGCVQHFQVDRPKSAFADNLGDDLVYTVGYGDRKFEDFGSLLKRHGVSAVVDIRRFPTSKYPGFKREELEQNLHQHGLKYLFMGEYLGSKLVRMQNRELAFGLIAYNAHRLINIT